MPNSVMILVSLTLWLARGFANFPKKTNFLIEVFPFRGLLIVGGSIASKSLDRCLQCGKVNGALVSDAMELLEGASECRSPKEKWQITKVIGEDFLSQGTLSYIGVS